MFDLATVAAIALMCVLLVGYAKEVALLPVLVALVFPTDPLRSGIAAFVIASLFSLVSRLVRQNH